MTVGHIAAAVYNAQRTKITDRVWNWKDFHPSHMGATPPKASRQIVRGFAASASMRWADDFDPRNN